MANPMQCKLIIVCGSFKPNNAPTNRLISFLRGLDEMGVKTVMTFLYPNEKKDKMDSKGFSNIHFTYLWKDGRHNNKVVKYLRSFVAAWRYSCTLEKGSKVLLFGGSEYLPFFTRRKDLSVYQERTEHYNIAKLKPRFLQKKYLKSVRSLQGLFVISTTLREAYLQIGAKNVVIVNMTVDANRFACIEKQKVEHPYVAYCGSASNNKDGVDDLVKAFSFVHERYPKMRLFIIGKAPSKTDESGNVALVHQLGLDEVVVFTGVVPSEQMPQILMNARIVALARPDSLQARCGFPTKLGEYLLSGNPVVVTRVGDIPLFLENGKTALLSNQRDPKDFAEKLLWALDHEKESEAIGQAGREVALLHFNYKNETEKIVKTIF